ncbi:SMP-30/gluconolactonase/LRE family protein [Psychromicrobium xiongbiense]|uniref:SMP-30/gluconolactonase/LRE family protein n=1 Tax=Psychromicrobium xiongbiense TaxID=3051184 RepID=UPI0025533730|nr:SMP-30/gluconolactonase/LRE family protein [Psychromicrobium sp. YIM S02556]
MIGSLVVASEEAYVLGEGPVWDPLRGRLLWVDICRGSVLSGELEPDGRVRVVERIRLDETVGAVGVAANGEWIIAGADCLWVRSAGGRLSPWQPIISSPGGHRLNDGKADPAGRYLIGTLSLSGPSAVETLVSVAVDGTVRTIDDDLTLSNGLVWSADGTVLYSVDTERRTVYRRPYDVRSGEVGQRETFVRLEAGHPDGMTIDIEGYLWIAIWGLGQVQRYSPPGNLVQVIDVPAPHTSSVAFAGPDLETLVITTATQDLTEDQRAAYPDSGHLFTLRPGVRGLPQPLWCGSHLPDNQPWGKA